MRCKIVLAVGMSLIASLASAATPASGFWRTPEDNGRVAISDVGGTISGRLVGSARLDADPGLRDQNNAEPLLRSRLLKGLPLFSGLTGQTPTWRGKMYSPTDGKTYSAKVQLISANMLKVTGCIVFPLCRSQVWTRVP